MEVRFCGACGHTIHHTHFFCQSCGAKITLGASEASGLDHAATPGLSTAALLLSRSDFAKAIELLESLRDQHADSAIVRAYLGIAYLRACRVADAREELELAVKMAPESFICRSKLGEFFARLGFYDLALEQLDVAIGVTPPNAEAKLAALELRQHCREKSRGLYYRPLRYPSIHFHMPRWRGNSQSASLQRNVP